MTALGAPATSADPVAALRQADALERQGRHEEAMRTLAAAALGEPRKLPALILFERQQPERLAAATFAALRDELWGRVDRELRHVDLPYSAVMQWLHGLILALGLCTVAVAWLSPASLPSDSDTKAVFFLGLGGLAILGGGSKLGLGLSHNRRARQRGAAGELAIVHVQAAELVADTRVNPGNQKRETTYYQRLDVVLELGGQQSLQLSIPGSRDIPLGPYLCLADPNDPTNCILKLTELA